MLTCTVTLEKIVCEQHAARRWALERAIVIFSGHVRSSVGGVRIAVVNAPVEHVNGSVEGSHVFARSGCLDPGRVAQPTNGMGGEHRMVLRHVGARRFWCLSQIMDRPQ